MGKTTLGLEENVEAFLAYTVFFVSGIFFLVVEKENKFVRFHALQSIIAFLLFFSVQIILSPLTKIPILGILIDITCYVLNIASIVVWLTCMYKAYKHERYKLPIIGNIVEKTI